MEILHYLLKKESETKLFSKEKITEWRKILLKKQQKKKKNDNLQTIQRTLGLK